VIHDTGAHGYSMGYNYNGRLRSAEVLLRPDGSADLIRRAERPGDYFATLDVLPCGRELLAKSRADAARRRAQDERLAVAAQWNKRIQIAEAKEKNMDVDMIFKIAAIGIIVAVLNQVLIRSGREEQAMMTTLAGLIVVLMMLISEISNLFDTVKSVFGL